MGTYYASIRLYIEDASDLNDRITRIDAAIDCLLQTMASAALEDDTLEYRLDDGQTRINVQKRSVEQMTNSLKGLLRVKEIFKNQINGRVMRAMDHEAIRYLGNC